MAIHVTVARDLGCSLCMYMYTQTTGCVTTSLVTAAATTYSVYYHHSRISVITQN
jgi:hypothetical protein